MSNKRRRRLSDGTVVVERLSDRELAEEKEFKRSNDRGAARREAAFKDSEPTDDTVSKLREKLNKLLKELREERK